MAGRLHYRRAIFTENSPVSEWVNIEGLRLIAVQIAPVWVTAGLGFHARSEQSTEWAVVYSGVTEYNIAGAQGTSYIRLDSAVFDGVGEIQLRSGTRASPVNQTIATYVTLILESVT